jgi:hypothetical protein
VNHRITKAVARVKEWHRLHGEWPARPSSLVEDLDLTGEDIEAAVESGLLRVVFPPGGPCPRLVAL